MLFLGSSYTFCVFIKRGKEEGARVGKASSESSIVMLEVLAMVVASNVLYNIYYNSVVILVPSFLPSVPP